MTDSAVEAKVAAKLRVDMKALGIDFGSQRVGVSISDPEGRFALPLDTLSRQSDRQVIALIAQIAERESIELLVLGEPLRLDGSPGTASQRVRRFATQLAKTTGLPIRLIDESLTSVEAATSVKRFDPTQQLSVGLAQTGFELAVLRVVAPLVIALVVAIRVEALEFQLTRQWMDDSQTAVAATEYRIGVLVVEVIGPAAAHQARDRGRALARRGSHGCGV